MANPRIEVEIGAVIDGLQKGFGESVKIIDTLEKQAQDLEKALKNATSIEQISTLNVDLAKTRSALSQLRNAGLEPVVKSTEKLTDATRQYNSVGVDFARIVQDAPFGIIGVGNNITQLAGSFQNLKNQTGSTSQALKTAFASIFSGSNALILGISTLTTVFTVLQMKGFFKTEEAAKSLTEQLEDYRSKLETLKRLSIEGQSNASREIQNFQLLRAQAQNANIPLERRLEAVNQLQKNYPSYLGNLSKEQILTGNVGNAYANLTKEIIATAKAKAFSDQISKNSLDTLSILVQEEERVLKIVEAREKLESIRASTAKATGQDLVALRQQEQIQQQRINELIKQQTDSASQRVKIEEQNQKLTAQIASQIDNGAKFTQTQLTAVKELKTSYDGIKRTIEDINRLPRIGLPRSGDRDALLARREQLLSGGQVELTPQQRLEQAIANAPGIGTKLPFQPLADGFNKVADQIQLRVEDLSEAFTGVGAVIGRAFNNPQLGSFLGQFTQFVTKIIVGAFAVSKANAIAGATQSSLFTGPAAVFTLPAFIATSVGLVASAFASIKGGGSRGASSVGSSGVGGGSSFSGGATGFGFAQNREIRGELVARGQDLVYVFNEANTRINKG